MSVSMIDELPDVAPPQDEPEEDASSGALAQGKTLFSAGDFRGALKAWEGSLRSCAYIRCGPIPLPSGPRACTTRGPTR